MSTCRSITIPLWPTYVLPTSECDLLLRPNFDGPKRHEKVLAFFSPDLVDIFSSRNVTVVVVAAAAAVAFIESKCTASASRCYVFVKRSR